MQTNQEPLTKQELKSLVVEHLDDLINGLNKGLTGKGLEDLAPTIKRLGRGKEMPHWYEGLKTNGQMPNFDGKTVGSILEMVFVAVLEHKIIVELKRNIKPLRINPARGVDLPDLDLGIKSPSKNFCTSEPFFSAYERLYGNECDALILLTDYQEAKKSNSRTIQITDWKYVRKTEIADTNLCKLALQSRTLYLESDEFELQRLFRFLAYINQSDWRAVQILKLIQVINNEAKIVASVGASLADFDKRNREREKNGLIALPDTEKIALEKIIANPNFLGIVNAADNWVVEVLKEAARAPSENEWVRLKTGPLDGKIGMSFALQWRYNFRQLFRQQAVEEQIEVNTLLDLDQE